MTRAVLASLQQPGSRIALTFFFAAAGILHFIFPQQYSATIPAWLPSHGALVAISGLCEIAGALGLLIPRLRRAAGIGLLLLCVAVLPANIQMWLAALAADKAIWIQLLLLFRLPLQIPLMVWIWQTSRGRVAH